MWQTSRVGLRCGPNGIRWMGHRPLLKRPLTAPRSAVPVTRVSVLDALQSTPAHAEEEGGRGDTRKELTSSVASGQGQTSSPCLQPSAFERTFQVHQRSQSGKTIGSHLPSAAPGRHVEHSPSSSLAEMKAQQSAIRHAYAFADRHHRIRLKKDRRVLAQEVRAFRAEHGDRRPTAHEVSPFTDVSLPPVTALQAMAHLDSRKSPLHKEVQDSLLLQQSITRSELMKSNERTLVRCLSCFHVYGARPRDLWGEEDHSAIGGSGQQSWITLEREKQRVARAERLMRHPKLRKTLHSVGRRRQQEARSPLSCPQCGSPRAQWAMEYIHYRTHAK